MKKKIVIMFLLAALNIPIHALKTEELSSNTYFLTGIGIGLGVGIGTALFINNRTNKKIFALEKIITNLAADQNNLIKKTDHDSSIKDLCSRVEEEKKNHSEALEKATSSFNTHVTNFNTEVAQWSAAQKTLAQAQDLLKREIGQIRQEIASKAEIKTVTQLEAKFDQNKQNVSQELKAHGNQIIALQNAQCQTQNQLAHHSNQYTQEVERIKQAHEELFNHLKHHQEQYEALETSYQKSHHALQDLRIKGEQMQQENQDIRKYFTRAALGFINHKHRSKEQLKGMHQNINSIAVNAITMLQKISDSLSHKKEAAKQAWISLATPPITPKWGEVTDILNKYLNPSPQRAPTSLP